MVDKKDYIKRIADDLVSLQLEAAGVVVIEGAKWCGKSTTAKQQAASMIRMDDPKRKDEYLRLAKTDVEELLAGDTPRLIDEWQKAPQVWDELILTCSLIPAQDVSDGSRCALCHFGNQVIRVVRCLLLTFSKENSKLQLPKKLHCVK